MTGYVRQSSPDIQPDEEITADPLNREFDAIQEAFHRTSGHTHDGTTGSGPKIVLNDAVTGTLPIANGGTGTTTATGILGVIKTVDGVGSGLDADLFRAKAPQTSQTDTTSGNYLTVGAFGLGRHLNLRGTLYELGTPLNLYSTGLVTGYSEGGAAGLNIPGIGANSQGILISNFQWSELSGSAGMSQIFTNKVGTSWRRTVVSDTTWSAWEKLPDNTDLATINASIATKLNSSAYTAADVLAKVKTVDGTGSGLDADLFQGQPPSFYSETASSILTKLKTVDGVGSGLDADVLDGMAPTTVATGNTIVQRNSSGDFTGRYLFSENVSMSHGAVTRNTDNIFYSSNDDFVRKNTAAGFKTSLAITVADVASLQSSLDAKINKAGDNLIGSLGFGTGGLGALMSEATMRVAPPTGNANIIANAPGGSAVGQFTTASSTSYAGINTSTDVGLNNEWQSYGTAYVGGTRFSAGPGGTAFSAPRNLHIGSYGTYPVNFYTNNIARLQIFSNGYMGFGNVVSSATATPGEGIHFAPTGALQSRSAGTGGFVHLSFYNNAAVTPTQVAAFSTSGTDCTFIVAGTYKVSAPGGMTVNGSAVVIDGSAPSFTSGMTIKHTDNTHYGFLNLSRNDGARGAYIGFGNSGLSQIDFYLDQASNLNIIKTGVTSALLVNGNGVWHEGNDGAGSNLDAGYLGGVSYSSYATTAAVPGIIAGMSAGALGTYAFLKGGLVQTFGGTVAGSGLKTSGTDDSNGGAPSGSWRCMGSAGSNFATLYLRYA